MYSGDTPKYAPLLAASAMHNLACFAALSVRIFLYSGLVAIISHALILSHTHIVFSRLKHLRMLQAIRDECEPREANVKEKSVGTY